MSRDRLFTLTRGRTVSPHGAFRSRSPWNGPPFGGVGLAEVNAPEARGAVALSVVM